MMKVTHRRRRSAREAEDEAAPSAGEVDARASLMSMSGREYLDALQLRVYFTDVVHQLLACRDEHPVEFMHQYFRRVGAMEHVVGREYAFVSATCWNRRAFVLSCHATFGALALVELTVADFHQLLMLLCPDFPKAPVDAVVHLLPRALFADAKIRFSVLATAFYVHWRFVDFFRALDAASMTCAFKPAFPVVAAVIVAVFALAEVHLHLVRSRLSSSAIPLPAR